MHNSVVFYVSIRISGGAENQLRHFLSFFKVKYCQNLSLIRNIVYAKYIYKYSQILIWGDDALYKFMLPLFIYKLAGAKTILRENAFLQSRLETYNYSLHIRVLQKILYLLVDEIVVQSKTLREDYKITYPPKAIHYNYNYIPLLQKIELNNNILSENPINILFVGQMYPIKGADLLLDLCSMINRQFMLRIVTKDRNRKICEQLSSTNYNIEIFDATYSKRELYKNVHILINLSRSEGMPNTVYEALSIGINVCTLKNTPVHKELFELYSINGLYLFDDVISMADFITHNELLNTNSNCWIETHNEFVIRTWEQILELRRYSVNDNIQMLSDKTEYE